MYKLLRILFLINILVVASCAVTKTTTTVNKSTATAKATSNDGSSSATATATTKVTKKTIYNIGSKPGYDKDNDKNGYDNDNGDCGECDGALQGVKEAANRFSFHNLHYLMETSDESDDIISLPLNGFFLLCYSALYTYGQTWENAKIFCGAETREQIRCSLAVMLSHTQNPPRGIEYRYGLNFVTNYKTTEEFSRDIEEITTAVVRQYNILQPMNTTRKINRFISEQTNNRVRRAITKPSIFSNDPDARKHVLASGAYLEALWQTEFDSSNITTRNYYDMQNNLLRVPFIYQKTVYNHTWSPELDLDIVSIPYVDGFFNYVMFIPRNKCVSKLVELVEKLKVPGTYTNLMARQKPACIELIAPLNGDMSSETDLGEALKSTGILDQFFDPKKSEYMDFYGNKQDNIYLGDARLKIILNNTFSGVEPPSNECVHSNNLEEITIVQNSPAIFTIETNGVIRIIAITSAKRSYTNTT